MLVWIKTLISLLIFYENLTATYQKFKLGLSGYDNVYLINVVSSHSCFAILNQTRELFFCATLYLPFFKVSPNSSSDGLLALFAM